MFEVIRVTVRGLPKLFRTKNVEAVLLPFMVWVIETSFHDLCESLAPAKRSETERVTSFLQEPINKTNRVLNCEIVEIINTSSFYKCQNNLISI